VPHAFHIFCECHVALINALTNYLLFLKMIDVIGMVLYVALRGLRTNWTTEGSYFRISS
jgi:hypothetical protein